MLHLIEGDEYRNALMRDELKANFLRDGEAAIEQYDGKDHDLTLISLFHSVSTMSFFSTRKIIIVEDAGELIDREKKFLSQKEGLKIFEEIVKTPDDVLVIFTIHDKPIAKNSRVYKMIQEHGKITEMKKFWHDPNEGVTGQFRKWLESEIKKRKLDLKDSQINTLVARVGSDLRQICNELDKLVIYLDGDKASELDENSFRKLIPPSRELLVFNLIDAIAMKKRKRALAYLVDLLSSGENESTIVTLIHRQLRIIYTWHKLQAEGMTADEIAKQLELSDFKKRKLAQQVVNFPKESMPFILSALIKADEEIKSSLLPNSLVLEKLIIRLTG